MRKMTFLMKICIKRFTVHFRYIDRNPNDRSLHIKRPPTFDGLARRPIFLILIFVFFTSDLMISLACDAKRRTVTG